jgi:hypothetical protein
MATTNNHETPTIWRNVFAIMFVVSLFAAGKIVQRHFRPSKGDRTDSGNRRDVTSRSAVEENTPEWDGDRVGILRPGRIQFKRSPRSQKKDGIGVEAERDVRRWLF